MKAAEGFLKTSIAGIPYLLPYGQKAAVHAPSIHLNEASALLWDALTRGADRETLVSLLADHYHADKTMRQEIKDDVNTFLNSLIARNMICETAVPAANLQTDFFPKQRSFSSAPNYFKIASLHFSWFGPKTLFDTYFKDFSCTAAAADQTITICTKQPALPQSCTQTLLLQTSELHIFSAFDTYRFTFTSHWGIHEMRLKKDGSAVIVYCTEEAIVTHANDIFHALRFAFLICAQQHQLFVLHSASILYQNQAWLFSGCSGTGKSTHAGLWRKQYGTPVLNGDLNILGIKDGIAYVYGLPWCGTSKTYTTAAYPLGGIVFLKQASFEHVVIPSLDEQILFLLQRMISPVFTKELLEQNLHFAKLLAPLTHIFRLFCTKEASAAQVMKAAIDANSASI